jgi:hypothetical protein
MVLQKPHNFIIALRTVRSRALEGEPTQNWIKENSFWFFAKLIESGLGFE